MKYETLRYWAILDLAVLRPWLTDVRIRSSHLIDNRDGTFGIAFDLRWVPADAFIAISDPMARAIDGETIEALPTAAPRILRPPPCLQELVARHGGYNCITPEAWAEWDRAIARYRADMRNDLLAENKTLTAAE